MELRFYSFINFYLSSIQQGIQTAHLVSDMMGGNEKFWPTPNQDKMIREWAKNHKTIITLNGGNAAMLRELYEFLSNPNNPYPVVKFHEDEQSLDGALTGVGMVLSEEIFNAQYDRETGYYVYESEDGTKKFTYTEGFIHELIGRVKSCRLAS